MADVKNLEDDLNAMNVNNEKHGLKTNGNNHAKSDDDGKTETTDGLSFGESKS